MMEWLEHLPMGDSSAVLELQRRYQAAKLRLLVAQQEKMEATTEFLAVRDSLEAIQARSEAKSTARKAVEIEIKCPQSAG